MNTSPTAAPSAATQVCALLRNLCKSKQAIDLFYDSKAGQIMQELPDLYMSIDRLLADVIGSLSEYAGIYLYNEYLTDDGHE